ncbi:MAG: homoserine dehydrogenase, partial [Candidatus Aenigmarchaeota archaeon]|nr:homoserine dehydrogenase [Candidatus Aenigmarchaeota archaeon]
MPMQLYIGLIGFGNVGTGVVKYFHRGNKEPYNIELKKVAVANVHKAREVDFPYITGDVKDILDDPEINIVVELMGGESPARDYILEAISKGKSVVTA